MLDCVGARADRRQRKFDTRLKCISVCFRSLEVRSGLSWIHTSAVQDDRVASATNAHARPYEFGSSMLTVILTLPPRSRSNSIIG